MLKPFPWLRVQEERVWQVGSFAFLGKSLIFNLERQVLQKKSERPIGGDDSQKRGVTSYHFSI